MIVGDAKFSASIIGHQVLRFAEASGRGAYHDDFLVLPFVFIVFDVPSGGYFHVCLAHGGAMTLSSCIPVSLGQHLGLIRVCVSSAVKANSDIIKCVPVH